MQTQVKRFFAWLESVEGQVALAESERRMHETEELLATGRNIPWERLHEPFTI